MNHLTAIEFYSGIGGLHYALLNALPQAQVIAAFDINGSANDIYELNFGARPYQKNLDSVSVLMMLDTLKSDMWLMSPPCQPYTRQGLQLHDNDDRAKSFILLLHKIKNLIYKPNYILIENVMGFETSHTRHLMLNLLINEYHYHIREFCLSPDQFKIPNSRPRYFCIAKLNSHFNAHLTINNGIYLLPTLTLTVNTNLSSSNDNELLSHYLCYDDIDIQKYYVFDDWIEKYADILNIATPYSKTTNCFTKSYYKYAKGTGSVLATQNFHLIDQVENLQNKNNRSENEIMLLKELCRNLKLRFLTPKEICNLHKFPSDFKFSDNLTLRQKYALIGNSLNVKVVSTLIQYLIN